ncbi:MAG TPA: DUF3617 family protein [Mariprofundaceae bacterium]|nr:DUF3617 family protein [Mariprofundaceae bacterium]
MKIVKLLLAAGVVCGLCAGSALAATGEYWEVKVRMEMADMPFAMPATTHKVCIAGNAADDPRNAASDKDCKISDVRKRGKKTTWKVRCNKDGEVMTGTGEITSLSSSSYKGKMQTTGMSDGEPVDMTQYFEGRKLGGACDAKAPSKQVQKMQVRANAQMASSCDPAAAETSGELVGAGIAYFGDHGVCASRAKEMCARVGKDAYKIADTYDALVEVRKNSSNPGYVDVAKACGINMKKARASVCRRNAEGDMDFLDRYCPAEAKAYREKLAREEAARDYTASRSYTSDGGSKSTTDNILENASKLKGLFGF